MCSGPQIEKRGKASGEKHGRKKIKILMKGMKNALMWQIYGTGYASDKLKVGMMVVMTTH